MLDERVDVVVSDGTPIDELLLKASARHIPVLGIEWVHDANTRAASSRTALH